MTRGDARKRLLVVANEMGYKLGRNGQPFPQNSPAWIAQRISLAAGVQASNAVLNTWARDLYAEYLNGYNAARRAEVEAVGSGRMSVAEAEYDPRSS